MRAGDLRHHITIQRNVPVRNEVGEEVTTWQDVATVWASIEPLQGRELFTAQQVQAELTTRIRIRYIRGITPAMRIVYGSRMFNILSAINVDERNRELQLMCQEVV